MRDDVYIEQENSKIHVKAKPKKKKPPPTHKTKTMTKWYIAKLNRT